MLLLPSVHLKDFLNILLSLLAINSSKSATTAPAQTIIAALEEYDVPPSISVPALNLFGTVEDGQWTANVERMVREVGLGILCAVKKNKKRDEFMSEWQEEVGETWREYTDLKLLEVRVIFFLICKTCCQLPSAPGRIHPFSTSTISALIRFPFTITELFPPRFPASPTGRAVRRAFPYPPTMASRGDGSFS